jgi:hypothetical protein
MAVFTLSLLGLILLFGLKVLELSWNARTPLHQVRRIGDPLVCNSWAICSRVCKMFALHATHTSTVWTATTLRKTHLFFDELMHKVATRLNRYLRGRRMEIRGSGTVSPKLKTVLEKTGQTTTT